MKLLNYTIEANLRSLQPFSHIKLHRHRHYKHLVWWKLSILFGKTHHCDECGIETGLEEYCDNCFEYLFCECGTRLTDSYGNSGDGFCVRCR